MGSIIDAETRNYFQRDKVAKARQLLLLKWAMVGLFLTSCYKETLLSTLIAIEYEESLDSVNDILAQDKFVLFDGNSGMADLLKSDPRENVKALNKMSKSYTSDKGAPPTWVINGYRNEMNLL